MNTRFRSLAAFLLLALAASRAGAFTITIIHNTAENLIFSADVTSPGSATATDGAVTVAGTQLGNGDWSFLVSGPVFNDSFTLHPDNFTPITTGFDGTAQTFGRQAAPGTPDGQVFVQAKFFYGTVPDSGGTAALLAGAMGAMGWAHGRRKLALPLS